MPGNGSAASVKLEMKEDARDLEVEVEVVVFNAEVDGVSKRVVVSPEEVATVVLLIKGKRAGAASRFTTSRRTTIPSAECTSAAIESNATVSRCMLDLFA